MLVAYVCLFLNLLVDDDIFLGDEVSFRVIVVFVVVVVKNNLQIIVMVSISNNDK